MANKRLVVIDDDPAYRGLCRDALGGDFEVRCAEDGAEGLRACREAAPDVVLLDIRMPRADGLAVLRALGADPATRGVPVVVFTAAYLDAAAREAVAGHPNVRGLLDKVTRVAAVRAALVAAAGN